MLKPRRKKLTRVQGFALVDAFNESGLKASAFCVEQKIRHQTLSYWISAKRRRDEVKGTHGRLLPVKTRSSAQTPPQPPLRILLNAGVAVEVPSGVDSATFNQILGACYDVVNR